jgi:DUF1680 family protein
MVRERGRRPSPFEEELRDVEAMRLSPWMPGFLAPEGTYSGEYLQDHAPVEEHETVVGHAVRAMYLYCAAAEIAKPGDPLHLALERCWKNLTNKRVYVTGGIGPSEHNEGFTRDYDLPNRTAYAETCAAVGLAFWGRRMLELTGASRYADVMERAILNGALSGVSLDGTLYFYTNPLESHGEHQRVPWFGCACCPPNIARLVGSLARYAASISDEAFWLHFPAGMETEVEVHGEPVRLSIKSDYPWSGEFSLEFESDTPEDFEVRVRVPDWCESGLQVLSGQDPAQVENGYAVFRGPWRKGDRLEAGLPMTPKWLSSDSRVLDNAGRMCLARGPLIYCLEERDLGSAPQRFVSSRFEVPSVGWKPELLQGVNVLRVVGTLDPATEGEVPYRTSKGEANEEVFADLVPYFAWNNRGPNAMQVWLRS